MAEARAVHKVAIRICSFWGRSRYDQRLGHKSRMGREFHVRFREGLGVKIPRATRLVMGFACEEDARRVLAVLPKRFGKYGLTIHPDKTRLVPFGRPSRYPRRPSPEPETQPGSFDFLGFTHYWSRSRKGNWVVKQKTAGSRFHRAVKRIGEWLRLHRHVPIREQSQTLAQKLRGHYAYYGGVVGNLRCLQRFRYEVVRLWQKWLSRRKRCGQFSWERLNQLLKVFQLPQPSQRVSPCAASP